MTGPQTAFVTASSVCTPLGVDIRAVDAAVRAGILPIEESAVLGREGEPLRASRLEWLDPDLPRDMRVREAAGLALEGLAQQRLPPSLAVYLAMPHDTGAPDADARTRRWLAERIAAAFPAGLHSLVVLAQGRSAFFFALQAALSELASGAVAAALVGGVDSLCDPATLAQLDAQERLLGASPHGGLVPAEGAAFLLLERADAVRAAEGPPMALALAAATAWEARHFGADVPNGGEALSTVFRELGGRVSARAGLMLTCETGEPFWTEELAHAYLRSGALMPEPFSRTMQAEAFGDLGAAAGAVMTALGVHVLLHRAPAPDATLLVCGSSDDGHVGGCLLQAAA